MPLSDQAKSDGELVRQTLGGRRTAYEELVRRWGGRVVACCHARARRPDAADDLAQETLLRGFQHLARLEDPDKFGAWLRGIAERVCLDWLKAKARTQVSLDGLRERASDGLAFEPVDAGDQRAELEDETERLMRQVHLLPEELRETLLLYYYEDVTYQELATLLQVSAATVNARLTKARAILRQRLHDPRGV